MVDYVSLCILHYVLDLCDLPMLAVDLTSKEASSLFSSSRKRLLLLSYSAMVKS